MPVTMRTTCIRLNQMHNLLKKLEAMSNDMHNNNLLCTILVFIVYMVKIVDDIYGTYSFIKIIQCQHVAFELSNKVACSTNIINDACHTSNEL